VSCGVTVRSSSGRSRRARLRAPRRTPVPGAARCGRDRTDARSGPTRSPRRRHGGSPGTLLFLVGQLPPAPDSLAARPAFMVVTDPDGPCGARQPFLLDFVLPVVEAEVAAQTT